MAKFKSMTFKVINPLKHDIPSSGIKSQPAYAGRVKLSSPTDSNRGQVKHISAGRLHI